MAEAEVDVRQCFSCGEAVKKWDRFCPSCKADQALASFYATLGDAPTGAAPIAVTTRPFLAGHRIVVEHGVVTGSTVRARHLGSKLAAGVSQTFGGEISGYTRLVQDARQESFERMCDAARAQGANAVVSVAFSIGELFDIAVELLAFGTAVTVETEPGDSA